jgi:hypothetical protein
MTSAVVEGAIMRLLTVLVAALIALTACAGSSDDSEQHHRPQTGPYIGGSAGPSF